MRPTNALDGKRTFLYAVFALMVLFPASTAHGASVEEKIKEFFKDDPVMVEIARCESKFRQFSDDGTPLRGGWGGGMVGVFQIYESVHAKSAETLGFDLQTLEGNLGYAKHLFKAEGTSPWNSAKSCWGETVTAKQKSSQPDKAELQKKIKELKKLVVKLQKLLEQKKKAQLSLSSRMDGIVM